MRQRTYQELIQLTSFEDRFEYLSLSGLPGYATFGHDRYLNQQFYASREWRNLRQDVIARDEGRDLGIEGYDIFDRIVIHHLVPIKPEDFDIGNPLILDMDNLITTTHNTHNAIHYGDISLLPRAPIERRPGDTKLW